jgi:adenylate kinase
LNAPLVFVGGISGVGKTTLLTRFTRSHDGVTLVSAGELIRQATGSRDRVPVNDPVLVEQYQALLVSEFRRRAAEQRDVILMDGHYTIATAAGVVTVPVAVFRALAPQALVLLSSEPAEVTSRRLSLHRGDPATVVEELEAERAHALRCAQALRLTLHELTGDMAERELSDLTRRHGVIERKELS